MKTTFLLSAIITIFATIGMAVPTPEALADAVTAPQFAEIRCLPCRIAGKCLSTVQQVSVIIITLASVVW